MSKSNNIKISDILKGLLFIASLPLLFYLCGFILAGLATAFFIVADFIGNPFLTAILGALLLTIVVIAGGLGKATGETFGAHKARNLFVDLKGKINNKNK